MTTSADRTRQRILDAATEEFAARGIAGARVDRIAEASGMSKPMLYAHFGAKDRLFDAVFAEHVIANGDRVPLTPDDLPGYAMRLYDDYLADPALARLVMWKRLERDATGFLYPGLEDFQAGNVRALAEAQEAGRIRADLDPEDVFSLLIATAASWAQISITRVATADEPDEVHARRREALAAYVRDGLCVG
jgi:AcrR family transcriptional regulator